MGKLVFVFVYYVSVVGCYFYLCIGLDGGNYWFYFWNFRCCDEFYVIGSDD